VQISLIRMSNSVSRPDPSCLTLGHYFHQLWATLEHHDLLDTDTLLLYSCASFQMWCHLGKPGFWISKLCFFRSAFPVYSYSYIDLKVCRKKEKCFLLMLISPRSAARQNAWRLIEASSFCPSISQGFLDDVANGVDTNSIS